MFKENDLVMYGKVGVCRICKIGIPEFTLSNPDRKEYYFLEPLYHSGKFYAPIDGDRIALRPVISERKAKSLISKLDSMDYEKFSTVSIQQLSQHYQRIIDTHKCDEILAMLKSIYAKGVEAGKNNKKLGQIDKRYMKMAEELIFGELACALGTEIEDVQELVTKKLEKSFS